MVIIFMKLTIEEPKWYEYLKLRPDFLLRKCFTISNTEGYLDCGCSNHMTSDKTLLSFFTPKKGGFISYSDNNVGNILDFGTICKSLNPWRGTSSKPPHCDHNMVKKMDLLYNIFIFVKK